MTNTFTQSKTVLLCLLLSGACWTMGFSQVIINEVTPSGGPYKIDNEKPFDGSPFYSFLTENGGTITNAPKKRVNGQWVDVPMPAGDFSALEVLGTVGSHDWAAFFDQSFKLAGVFEFANNNWTAIPLPAGDFDRITYLGVIGTNTYFILRDAATRSNRLYTYSANNWTQVNTPTGFNSFYFAEELINRLYFVLYNFDNSIPAASDFSIQYFDGTNWTAIANPTDFTAELHFLNYVGEAGNHLYFSYHEEGTFKHIFYKLLGGTTLSRVAYDGEDVNTYSQVTTYNETPVLLASTFQSTGTLVNLLVEENGKFVKKNPPGTPNTFLTKWNDKYFFQSQDAEDKPKLYRTSNFTTWSSVSSTPDDWTSSATSSSGEDNLLIFLDSEFKVKTYEITDFDAPCSKEGAILKGTLSKTVHVVKTIETDGKVPDGKTAILKAGESVTLTNGFHAETGSSFQALIEACPSARLLEIANNELVTPKLNKAASDFSALKVTPNPITQNARISYELAKSGTINLHLIDALGRQVVLIEDNQFKSVGTHQISFQPADYLQGVYFLILETKEGHSLQKIVIR